MELEFKLSIVFMVVGASNLLLRSNRNWVLGYRSARALKSHRCYAYANTIYGIAMMIIGLVYLVVQQFYFELISDWPNWQKILIGVAYFAICFMVIEYRLFKKFR